jgi:hypothetical protein
MNVAASLTHDNGERQQPAVVQVPLKAWNPTRSTLEQQPLSSQFAAMASLHTLPKVFPSGMKTAPGDLISGGRSI